MVEFFEALANKEKNIIFGRILGRLEGQDLRSFKNQIIKNMESVPNAYNLLWEEEADVNTIGLLGEAALMEAVKRAITKGDGFGIIPHIKRSPFK